MSARRARSFVIIAALVAWSCACIPQRAYDEEFNVRSPVEELGPTAPAMRGCQRGAAGDLADDAGAGAAETESTCRDRARRRDAG